MELKEIDKNIKTIKTMGTRMNEVIHTTAVAIVQHAMDHGDCTRALAIVQAMPNSMRKTHLIKWFGQYSPIGMNLKANDGKGKVGLHKPDSKSYNAYNIDGAKANPFWQMADKDQEDTPDTTLEKANESVSNLAKRLQKRLDEGKVAANDVDAITSMVEQLNRLAA